MPVYNRHLENYLIVLRFCFVLWQKFKELMMRNHVQFESNLFLNWVSGTSFWSADVVRLFLLGKNQSNMSGINFHFFMLGSSNNQKLEMNIFISSWIISFEEYLSSRLKSTRTQQWSYSFQWTEKAICFLSPVIIMEKRKRKKTQNKISEHY